MSDNVVQFDNPSGNNSFDPYCLQKCDIKTLGLCKKGEYIYEQGSSANEFYIVTEGLIGLYHVLENGKEALMRIYAPYDYFGYRTLLGKSIYHCSARALQNSTVIKIIPHNVESFLASNPTFAHFLVENLARELQDAENRLARIAFSKSAERVAVYTKYLKEKYPNHKWTYREIAEFAGCETETTIRVSRQMQNADMAKDSKISKKSPSTERKNRSSQTALAPKLDEKEQGQAAITKAVAKAPAHLSASDSTKASFNVPAHAMRSLSELSQGSLKRALKSRRKNPSPKRQVSTELN